jgi:hypothetical protein
MDEPARVLDGLAVEIAAMSVSTEPLRAYGAEYGQIAARIAKALRQIGRSVEAGDAAATDEARTDLDIITGQETRLIEQINTLCAAAAARLQGE